MLIADYHTHTTYSHGKGSIEDNVRAAIQAGLPMIGIADHGPKHMFFGVRMPAFVEMRKEVDRLQDVYGDRIDIQLGLEANLVGDGVTDVPKDSSLFDFVLLGYHKGVWPMDAIGRRWTWQLVAKNARRYPHENAESYIKAMANTKKLIAITHPGTYIPVDIPLLAKGARDYGVALEINESHRNMHVDDVRAAFEAGAPLLVSSDAHTPARVGECAHSIALAKEAGALENVINWKNEETPV